LLLSADKRASARGSACSHFDTGSCHGNQTQGRHCAWHCRGHDPWHACFSVHDRFIAVLIVLPDEPAKMLLVPIPFAVERPGDSASVAASVGVTIVFRPEHHAIATNANTNKQTNQLWENP